MTDLPHSRGRRRNRRVRGVLLVVTLLTLLRIETFDGRNDGSHGADRSTQQPAATFRATETIELVGQATQSPPNERFDRLARALALSVSEEMTLRNILTTQAARMAALSAESEEKLRRGMGPAPTREIAEQTDDAIDEATEVAAEGYVEAYRAAHAAARVLLGEERWRRFMEIERGGTAELALALYGGQP